MLQLWVAGVHGMYNLLTEPSSTLTRVYKDLTCTPIATGGRCCPLCLRLTQLLNAHFASLGDSKALGE